jgi:ATP-dependent Lhr-like helicase
MRDVYLGGDVPPYLDAKAGELLAEGRETFRMLRL